MSSVVERMENLLVRYENDVVEFPKRELRDAIDRIAKLEDDLRSCQRTYNEVWDQFCERGERIAELEAVINRTYDLVKLGRYQMADNELREAAAGE